MPVTIKDVAKAAGVSPSTVTRVIQNKSTISDETKKRVRKAMKELNYHPNLNARSLVSSYTQVIGLVLPDDSDAFYQILSSHLSFVVSPKSRLKTTMLFRLQQEKMRKNVSMRFLRWFMASVLTV